ncbi:MAG: DUF2085 domain-containing protein [Coriobacteriia bacterium]|nr:DUF2085 domain-containing protein [Coriobacteriia bacterium]
MLERVLHLIGFGLCHQLPERSFFGGGLQAPVCARDTGMYLGFTVAALLLLALGRDRRPSEVPPLPVALVAAAFVGAMAWDGVTSYAGLRATDNDVRLLTGLMAGFAAAAYAVPFARQALSRRPGRERVLGRPVEAVAWLAGVPAAFLLVRLALPLLGALYPVLVALAVLFAFTMVNLVVVGVFKPFEGSVGRPADLSAPLALAFALTLFEIVGSAALRQALVLTLG